MSINELNTTAKELLSIRSMIAELEAEAEALTDKLKAAMVEQGTEVLQGDRSFQPFRFPEVQSRPRRPVQSVQQADDNHPLLRGSMKKAPISEPTTNQRI